MKTKSIKTFAALFGAAVILSTSVLAGPGPQPQFQTRAAGEQKQVTVASSKAPTIALGGSQTEPKLFTVYGPRGLTFTFRK